MHEPQHHVGRGARRHVTRRDIIQRHGAGLLAGAVIAVTLAGCGVTLPTTTGSLFSGQSAPPAPPTVVNDTTSRALQVGKTAAQAHKCGFNFDAAKLRTQFLAAEAAITTNAADIDRAGQIYDTAYRGVSKAVAPQGDDYCSPVKTTKIKTALNRHLAGDYTPSPPEPRVDDEGLFSGWGGGSGDGMEQKFPMDNSGI